MLKRILFAAFFAALSAPSSAQTLSRDTENFIAANLIAIFYHELAHALIDQLELPIYGQEEDAADVMSVIMVNRVFKEDSAGEIIAAAAFGYLGEAKIRSTQGGEVAWWDVHGADLQRHYNIVCLYYGADTRQHKDFADTFDLPEGRAESCREEFQKADRSWGPVIEGLYRRGPGQTLWFGDEAGDNTLSRLIAEVIGAEVVALNAELSLPRVMPVRIGRCGFTNAFYDPNIPEIIICTEFAEYLAALAP